MIEVDPSTWTQLPSEKQQAAADSIRLQAPRLPAEIWQSLHLPLSDYWCRLSDAQKEDTSAGTTTRPLIVSISGLPGTGKSTLARVCAELIARLYRKNVATLSLDDLYLSGKERQELAAQVHPLLEIRGVPGTHDVALGLSLVERLSRATEGSTIALPRFDKTSDERAPESTWARILGRPDLIIVEGWFWGALPAAPENLDQPLNIREAESDPDGTWRRWVNEQLKGSYQRLFALSESHVHLEAPNREASLRWRIEQHRDDLAQLGKDPDPADPAALAHFLQLFERIGMLSRGMPGEIIARLGEDHLLESLSYPDPPDPEG